MSITNNPVVQPAVVTTNDVLARSLAPGFESADLWNSRDTVNKAMRAVGGAADRIGGLANICYSLSYAETAKGAHAGKAALRCPYFYLATTLSDLSNSLQAAHALWWDEVRKEDAPRPRRKPKTAHAT
jgi:hypothetical protein